MSNRLTDTLQNYKEAVARIREASGFEGARAAETEAREALLDLVGAILTFEGESHAGFGAKVRALATYTEIPTSWQMQNPNVPNWIAGLADTFNRQAGR